MTISKEALIALAVLPTAVVDLDGAGPVKLRGLSFGRATELGMVEGNPERAAFLLHHGLVEPELSLEEAAGLVATMPATVLQPICDALLELSGLAEGATKSNGAGAPHR